jgi:hypothetical protein
MSFSEVDLFGVYVAPISIVLVATWLLLLPLRRIADCFGFSRQMWHPALFWFAAYMILLSTIVCLLTV